VPADRERWVHFRPRTVLVVIGILVASFVVLKVLWISRHVLSWVFIAMFLALALNPAVDRLEKRFGRRGAATAVVFVATLVALALIGWLFIPTLVDQVNKFAHEVPDYLDDLTKGRGRLGFLQEKYHLVDKARKALREGGASKLFGLSGTAVALAKGVVNAVLATVTIAFMTFFMLLEGPNWVDRFFSLLRPQSRERWRSVGHDIYRTVGGYVSGNLLISLIAGGLTAIVLSIMGVPYAIALGLIVGILDLIPLAGATIAAIIVGAVAFIHSVPAGIVVVVFFIVYQQVENHILQPVVYGRTVQLSPLAVLISVLIGAELAGVLGALAAIPVAGGVQVVFLDWLRHRRAEPVPETGELVSGMWPSRRRRRFPRHGESFGSPGCAHARRLRPLGRRIACRRLVARADHVSLVARAGRPRRHQRAAEAARPRALAPFGQPLGCGTAAFLGDGRARVLQPQLRQRLLLRPPDRALLPDRPQQLLVGGREPALVVAGRRCGRCARHVVEQPRAPQEHAHGALARDRPLGGACSRRAGNVRRSRGHDRDHRLRRSALGVRLPQKRGYALT